MSFAYFVLTMVKLMGNETLARSQAVVMALRWGN